MPALYVCLMLLTSLLWGGNFVVGKSLVEYASPVALTAFRWIIAVICLFPIVLRKEKKLLPPAKSLVPLLLMGVTGVVLFNIFQFWALEETTATNVGLISTLNAISIAVFSALFLKDRINLPQILTMLFSLFGVLLVLTKGHLEMLLSLTFNKGDLWMMAAVCIWGIYSVLGKWAGKYTSPIMSTFYSGVFGLAILLPFSYSDLQVNNPDLSFAGSMLYTGLISTVVCMVLWNKGVQKVGAVTAGVFLNFNPVFTAILAFLLLGEKLESIQFLGGMIVILGCYLFTRLQAQRQRKSLPGKPEASITAID
ncbi:DMT family transporter [Bacillus infantis]|uniref:DMT family transporter n=1 Tax=Bacillus infantis TaxID=324767 RepID=UPI003CF9843E